MELGAPRGSGPELRMAPGSGVELGAPRGSGPELRTAPGSGVELGAPRGSGLELCRVPRTLHLARPPCSLDRARGPVATRVPALTDRGLAFARVSPQWSAAGDSAARARPRSQRTPRPARRRAAGAVPGAARGDHPDLRQGRRASRRLAWS